MRRGALGGAMPVRREVLNWIFEARADLRHAESSLEIGHYNWACFAAQQAAEKALKALAMHLLGELPRGHDLVRLYRLVRGHVRLTLNEDALARLTMYYTQARYPNAGLETPSEEISRAQAEEAVATARGVVDEVSKAIGDP